jgi:hypothetical protein
MWIALFCLATSIASIAIRVVTPSDSSSIEATLDQRKIDMATVPNESAKSDRLELHDFRAEAQIMPAAEAVPVEAPSTKPEVIKILHGRWQDSNAGLAPSEPPHRRTITSAAKKNAGIAPPKMRAEVWHCRQDAVGGLLRALDLSPRCNL